MLTHFCILCSKPHPMHYTIAVDDQKHLFVECPHGFYAIHYRPGLNIPTKESKRLIRLEAKWRQSQLL